MPVLPLSAIGSVLLTPLLLLGLPETPAASAVNDLELVLPEDKDADIDFDGKVTFGKPKPAVAYAGIFLKKRGQFLVTGASSDSQSKPPRVQAVTLVFNEMPQHERTYSCRVGAQGKEKGNVELTYSEGAAGADPAAWLARTGIITVGHYGDAWIFSVWDAQMEPTGATMNAGVDAEDVFTMKGSVRVEKASEAP